MNEIKNICVKIQPYYTQFISNYSKSYLSGMSIYVGDNVLEWWNTCNNVRYYSKNKKKLEEIVHILHQFKFRMGGTQYLTS